MKTKDTANLTKIRKGKLPKHIGVILDGNGRWAQKQGLKRLDGHEKGAEVIINLLDSLLALKIKVVSLYVFSTENWRRPKAEVNGLLSLLDRFVYENRETMLKKGIRLKISGDMNALPKKIQHSLLETIDATARGKKMVANFCLNYGSHDEITRAIFRYHTSLLRLKPKKMLKALENKISYSSFEKFLDTNNLPPVDFLIRTAGEKRLSNFLLLQAAYAELYFTETLWPDFNQAVLLSAIQEYQKRVRKYGGL